MRIMQAVTYWPVCSTPADGGDKRLLEECSPEDAEFWGVYLQDAEGFHHHVGDFPVVGEAVQLAESLSVVLEVALDRRYL